MESRRHGEVVRVPVRSQNFENVNQELSTYKLELYVPWMTVQRPAPQCTNLQVGSKVTHRCTERSDKSANVIRSCKSAERCKNYGAQAILHVMIAVTDFEWFSLGKFTIQRLVLGVYRPRGKIVQRTIAGKHVSFSDYNLVNERICVKQRDECHQSSCHCRRRHCKLSFG